MRYLKSTQGLKVTGLGESIYLAWIPNYLGLIPPKLRYKHDLNGDLDFIKSQGHIKAIGINSLVWCSGITIVLLIESAGYFNFIEMYPFYLGVVGFMIILDLVLIEATRWKVEKQKQRHANRVDGR